ncbi:wolframin [Alosa sapidissima]|uniref:wolframin n=1 Tax=Alosa sapidissima TaxID=34773 RepID=UPI001C08844A|nr:wolframin [Alosa sapidissima]XP_041917907.1 wolframin [Alosa sapidissima]
MDSPLRGAPPTPPQSPAHFDIGLSRAPHSPSQQSRRSQLNAASGVSMATGTDTPSSSSPQPSPQHTTGEGVSGDINIQELEERARAGDAKAQTEMGRYYLRLAEQEEDEVNSVTAVSWLLQAVKNGRRDAVKLLQRCLNEGKGITAENREEVRSLALESRFERSVRKAALLMYWKLNPERKSNITATELLDNADHINTETDGPAPQGPPSTSALRQKKVLEGLISTESGQCVRVEDFVENTKRYALGVAPSPALDGATGVDDDDDEEPVKNPDELPLHQKVLKFPLHAVLEIKEVLIEWASRAGMQWLSALIPTHHVNALVFFFIISNLTLDFFLLAVPLVVFYLAFASMAICTLRVFQDSRGWDNFRALTALLARFEPGLDVEQAESNFSWSHLEPHLYFLLSAFFLVLAFPLADGAWVPCAELAAVAIFFTVSSYLSLQPVAQPPARHALLTQAAIALCTLTDKQLGGWLGRLVGGAWLSVPLGDWATLNLGVPCLLYGYLLSVCGRMVSLRGFRGFYCVLLPYLLCFVWAELAGTLLEHSSPIGLMRTCVGYLLFVFALPVLALGIVAAAAVQLAQWFLSLDVAKMCVTVCVLACPVLLRWWTRFSMSPLAVLRSLRRSSLVKLILVWISALVLFCWLYVFRSEGMKVYNSTLSWQQYGEICGPRAWRDSSMAQTQVLCSHLEGHRVTWTGRFRYVRVTDLENGAQALVNMLPGPVADWLRCFYGDEYPPCEEPAPPRPVPADSPPPDPLCRIKPLAKHPCHLKRYDRLKMEVTVGMPRGGGEGSSNGGAGSEDDATKDIVLRASDEFRAVLLALRSGSLLEFSTVLEGRLGSKWPVFELKALRCLNCDGVAHPTVPAGRQLKLEQDWRARLRHALAFAFHFLFHPLFSVRADHAEGHSGAVTTELQA